MLISEKCTGNLFIEQMKTSLVERLQANKETRNENEKRYRIKQLVGVRTTFKVVVLTNQFIV